MEGGGIRTWKLKTRRVVTEPLQLQTLSNMITALFCIKMGPRTAGTGGAWVSGLLFTAGVFPMGRFK